MSKRQAPPPPPALGLADVYYVFFRHKWKIALISAVGIAAALLLPVIQPVSFQSEAKLYIRYVLESKSPTQVGANDSRIKSPDPGGESIINTELEILTSLDLAQQVADAIGPERILGKLADGPSPNQAGALIRKQLSAEMPKNSSVIRVVFQHSNPEIVQPVLKQLLNLYFKKHFQIHAVGAFDDFLTQEIDQLHDRLVETEEALRAAKAKAGVISLEDSKHAYAEQILKLRQDVLSAQAELAERQTGTNEMAILLHANPIAATNEAAVTYEKAAEYRRVCGLLDSLERKEQQLLVQFKEESSPVKEVQARIAATEKRKLQLEMEDPGLLGLRGTETKAAGTEPSFSLRNNLFAEKARVRGLESRIRVLTEQLDKLRKEAAALDEAEASIAELKRKKEIEEKDYDLLQRSLKQSRIDEKLGAGKVSNISTIQEPSPPFRAASKLRKKMLLVFLGSVAGAFALACLIEFYLDRSLKRPSDVEAKLGLPLFVAIPWAGQKAKAGTLRAAKQTPLLSQSSGADGPTEPEQRAEEAGQPAGETKGPGSEERGISRPGRQWGTSDSMEVEPWHYGHALRPYYEALRDRLITHFENRSLTRKPKLVAVTSCTKGCGVSSVATGLAASLSKTGDGNVLLVDMNLQSGIAHEFYQGELCRLDDALELEKRSSALVQDNLYVVTGATNNDSVQRVLPKRFTQLVPRLKASDYDYIIFDMPPVTQTSPTPRLARFMDMVLLVVESEKSDGEMAKRASSLLSESRADVGIVLNKGRTYVPRHFRQELE